MSFSENIKRGMDFLILNRNPDGGIPATKLGDPSGCWTTAEALEIFLLSPYYPKSKLKEAKEMAEFLLKNQLTDNGAWPLVEGSKLGSSMTTGHALAALSIAKDIFRDDPQFLDRIDKSINASLIWLRDNQNDNGGWSVQPESPYDKG